MSKVPSEKNILDLIKSSKGSDKTFAEFIAELLKGEFVELYLGDSYEDVSVEQITTSYPAVFCGKVIGAYKECLVLNTVNFNKHKGVHELSNIIFVNERSIRAINQTVNGARLQDMFLRSSDAQTITSAFDK